MFTSSLQMFTCTFAGESIVFFSNSGPKNVNVKCNTALLIFVSLERLIFPPPLGYKESTESI